MQQNAQQLRRLSDLDRYLDEELVPVSIDLDILQYWKTYSPKYHTLALLARDVLAIPASTVPSESAFSCAKKTINNYRSRLASDTVGALVCREDWLRGSDTTLDDIAGNIIRYDNDDNDDDAVFENFSLLLDVLKKEEEMLVAVKETQEKVTVTEHGRSGCFKVVYRHQGWSLICSSDLLCMETLLCNNCMENMW